MAGESKGFVVVETDDPEQMMKWVIAYWSIEQIKFVPIFEPSKFAELYQNTKK